MQQLSPIEPGPVHATEVQPPELKALEQITNMLDEYEASFHQCIVRLQAINERLSGEGKGMQQDIDQSEQVPPVVGWIPRLHYQVEALEQLRVALVEEVERLESVA